MWRPITLSLLLALACGGVHAAQPKTPRHKDAQAAQSAVQEKGPSAAEDKGTQPDERFTWGRFGEIAVYKPTRPIRSVAIFLSGDGGWSLGVTAMADHLRKDGALVAGIDLPHYLKQLEGGGDCAYPSGEFEDFAHHFEQRYGLTEYRYPILVGFSSGASLVYALLAQAPAGTFAGGVSLGFCPELEVGRAFCDGDRLATAKKPKHKGYDLKPAEALRDPWIALQGEVDEVCSAKDTEAFAAGMKNAELVLLPKVGHGYSVEQNWLPQFMDAYCKLAAHAPQNALPAPPQDLAGLPLVEVPAEPGKSSELLAVLITGDGGWAGLDQDVAKALSERGVPVVGLNSLKYFWKPRTPEETAADTDRIVRYYLSRYGKQRVVLLGYSQGADVLPFVLNRLTPEVRARLAGAAVIGMGEDAVFEFHFSNWLGKAADDRVPTQPEVDRLQGIKLACIYGKEEHDTLCPKLDRAKVTPIELPGAHHFNGDYERVAKAVLEAVASGHNPGP